MKIFEIHLNGHEDMVDITESVIEYIRTNRIKDGMVHLQVPDKTCAVTLAPNDDPTVPKEFLAKMNHLIPKYDGMRFTGFATASIKASVVGQTLPLLVRGGELIIGLTQNIFYIEFGGPAEKRYYYISHEGTTLAPDEDATMPLELAELYATQSAEAEAKRQEQERIVAEMRQEYAERAAREKAMAALAEDPTV